MWRVVKPNHDPESVESHLALDKVGKVVTQDSAGAESVEIENKPKLEHSLHSEA